MELIGYIIGIILITQINCKFFDPIKDHIELDLKYLRNCVEPANMNTYDLHLLSRKFNRTHVAIDMNINLTDLVDHTYEVEIEVRLWGDGGWKKNLFYDRYRNPCQRAKLLLGPLFYHVLEICHIRKRCPIEPGFYQYDVLYLDLSKMPFLFQDGRLYGVGRIIKNNVVHLCIEAEGELKVLMY